DADLLADLGVQAGHLAVAGGLDQLAVEALVEQRHRAAVLQALVVVDQPGAAQVFQRRRQLAGGALAEAAHRPPLQDEAQRVELLGVVEVEGPHLPGTPDIHPQVALALQAIQGLAHRRTADRHARGHLALAEAITGQQAELEDVVLEPLVDALGEVLRAFAGGLGGADQLHQATSTASSRSRASPGVTALPGAQRTDLTMPATGAVTASSIFIASTTSSGMPASTRWPGSTSTFHTLPHMSALTRWPSRSSSSSPTAARGAAALGSSSRHSCTSASKAAFCLAWKAAIAAALSARKRLYSAKSNSPCSMRICARPSR